MEVRADEKSRGIIQYDHGGNFMRFYTNSDALGMRFKTELLVMNLLSEKPGTGVSNNNGGELLKDLTQNSCSSDYAVVAKYELDISH